jgi:hypothetical protein
MWKTGQPLLCRGGGSEDSSTVFPVRYCRAVGANSFKALSRYLSIQNFDGVRSRVRSSIPPAITSYCNSRCSFPVHNGRCRNEGGVDIFVQISSVRLLMAGYTA